MATVTYIRESKQSISAMKGVIDYCCQDKKVYDENTSQRLVSGINCDGENAFAEFLATKKSYKKLSGMNFYQYVQSFSPEENITPQKAHEVAREFAEKAWQGYEVMVATHCDADHIHSHFVINSVSFENGLKLRQHPNTLTPSNKPEITGRYLWVNTTVKRILQNEFYIGTVTCHKTYTSKIYHVRKELPKEKQFIHENFAPAIIAKDKWEQVQFLLKSKVENSVRASSTKPCHRYTGLIECGDCGCTFVCKKRKRKDKPDRIEYNCNGYHRYGKEHCTAHRINEVD